MAADAMVEDVNYTMITDVQIAERTKATVTTDNVAALRQGTSGAKNSGPVLKQVTSINTRPVWSQMRTRLTWKFEEAKPVLEPAGQINRKYSLIYLPEAGLDRPPDLTPRFARCPTAERNKINFISPRRFRNKYENTGAVVANSLCDHVKCCRRNRNLTVINLSSLIIRVRLTFSSEYHHEF